MRNIREIVVNVGTTAPSDRKRILDKLATLADGGGVYASYNDGNPLLYIDEDGDVGSADELTAFEGDTFRKYTPEQFWEVFGEQNMRPEHLEFGQVIHVQGLPYAFIKKDQIYLWATSQCGMLTPICPTQVDEFKPDPTDQRKQAFLEMWRSQGSDYADDGWRDEISRWNWCVENLFNFIEQHRESIVKIFDEDIGHE